MRKIGEQWVETLKDGTRHMFKLVEEDGFGHRWVFMETGNGFEINLDVDSSCSDSEPKITCIKYLGILNDDGCLPSSWGEYPTIEAPSEGGEAWCVYAFLAKDGSVIKKECAWGETEQEAIDNWNKKGKENQ